MKIRNLVLCLMPIIAIGLAGCPLEQEKNLPNQLSIDPNESEIMEFFSQFGEDYVPSVTVAERIEKLNLGKTILETDVHTLNWEDGELYVLRDRESLIVDYSDPYRINWGDGEEIGWITAGPDSSLVFQVSEFGEITRIALDEIEMKDSVSNKWWSMRRSTTSTCVCFGIGTSGTCTDKMCNEGTACGQRHCRWKAGT